MVQKHPGLEFKKQPIKVIPQKQIKVVRTANPLNLSLDGQRKTLNAVQAKKRQDSAGAGSDKVLVKKAQD